MRRSENSSLTASTSQLSLKQGHVLQVRAEMGCKIFVEKVGTVFLKNGKSTIPQNVECWCWVPV